jgi:hypothetical protein
VLNNRSERILKRLSIIDYPAFILDRIGVLNIKDSGIATRNCPYSRL